MRNPQTDKHPIFAKSMAVPMYIPVFPSKIGQQDSWTAPETKTLQEVFDETSKVPSGAQSLGNGHALSAFESEAQRDERCCTKLMISKAVGEDHNYQDLGSIRK